MKSFAALSSTFKTLHNYFDDPTNLHANQYLAKFFLKIL